MSAPDRRPAAAPGAGQVFVAAVLIAAATLLAAWAPAIVAGLFGLAAIFHLEDG